MNNLAVMRKIVQAYTQGEKVTLDEALLEKINQCDRIYIIACGTSYNAKLGRKIFN